MTESDIAEYIEPTQEDLEFIRSIKSFKKWLISLENEAEKNEAVRFIHEMLIENDHENIANAYKLIDEYMFIFSEESSDALSAVLSIIKGTTTLLKLECTPPNIKALLARQYLELHKETDKYINLLSKNTQHTRSNKGWRIYARLVVMWIDAVNKGFTKPLELSASDLHRIIARRFGDLASLQNVSGFLREIKKTK